MKLYLLAGFLLAAFVVLDAHLGEESHHGEEKPYRTPRGIHKKKDGDCRYKKGPWSECDSTNVQKKTLTLKKGDNSCEPTKVMTRKCKKAGSSSSGSCKYDKGDWSECESGSNTRVRTDSLKPQSDSAACNPTRTLSKKCKKVACRYSKQAPWSACESGLKTKVLQLRAGNPQSCEPLKKMNKPCRN